MRAVITTALLLLSLMFVRPAAAATTSQDVDIQVVPSSTAPAVPAAAAAAGFTTLAFDSDMTKAFDIDCNNPGTGDHQWYLGQNGAMQGSCANLRYPHTDEIDGSTVLDIHLGPSTDDGGQFQRVGIETADLDNSHHHAFPINGYMECTVRMDAYTASHLPMWHNCWAVNADPVGFSNNSGALEFDITEFHGGLHEALMANVINWQCNGSCYGGAFTGRLEDTFHDYDRTKWNTYGMLSYQTSATNLHVKAFLNGKVVWEGDEQLTAIPTGPNNCCVYDELRQRNAYIIDLTYGCGGGEGDKNCTNKTIRNVYGDANGQAHVVADYFFYNPNFLIGISGVTGVTSPINGVFHGYGQTPGTNPDCSGSTPLSGPGTCDITLTSDVVFGQPVPFAGKYTGGGIINLWDDGAHEMHVYVKSMRGWSCDKLATTECSQYNPY